MRKLTNAVTTPSGEGKRPQIYSYHDYRAFLKDCIEYRKTIYSKFSIRALAREAKIAVSHLSMVLNSTRRASPEVLEKLAIALGLNSAQRSYLELLRVVADAESVETRLRALEKIQRFRGYRKLNTREFEAYQYLTRWYYVVIREMAGLGDFRPDPVWILSRLKFKVSVKDIEQALSFLKENGYLELLSDGTVRISEKNVECIGGIYRIALSQFHREMLALASQSLEKTPVEERNITGYTTALPAKYFNEVKEALNETLKKIASLKYGDEPADRVYHLTLALFPLTEKAEGDRKNEKKMAFL